jgi:hypothetical protein
MQSTINANITVSDFIAGMHDLMIYIAIDIAYADKTLTIPLSIIACTIS